MSYQITGTGRAVPAYGLKNDRLTELVDTSDEWIKSRCGIENRFINTTETMEDIASEAAQAALLQAGVSADQLDLIICATMQGDYVTPSLACQVQRRLGATCQSFDVNAACTGFLYALDVAAGYFARGRVKRVLVVAAECMSKHIDWTDRTTCVLFGDGAGAAVLEPGDHLLSVRLSAMGNSEFLYIPGTPTQFPDAEKLDTKQALVMNGQEVYRFAVGAMCSNIEAVLADAGLTVDDIRYVVAHQANRRILDAAKARLGFPDDKVIIALDRYGNTSAASVPIVLDELNRDDKIKRGDLLLLCAFGGGLTAGALIVKW